MDMSEKIMQKNACLRFFDRRWRFDGGKTLVKKFQCAIFNIVDLCNGMGIVWLTTTRTQVTAVILTVKCLNPLKLYPLSGDMFKKWFLLHTFYLFTCCYLQW